MRREGTHGVNVRAGRNDGRVEEDGEELLEEVHVEEDQDLLAPDGRVLAPDVEDHDDDHQEGADVEERRRCEHVLRASACT